MHRSSETIGAIAAALAKAQGELTNPEKSLTATISAPGIRGGDRTFRYAPLSSGLEIVRKSLGRQEIAAVQTTAIDTEAGLVRLNTVLAHSSGEWISSEWPVCPVSETATPHRMGAALTYARRYALFTLVGIAGEDDLDAPEIASTRGAPGDEAKPSGEERKSSAAAPISQRNGLAAPMAIPPSNGSARKFLTRPPVELLKPEESAITRDDLIGELATIISSEQLTDWAYRKLPIKNTLTADDARMIEEAFQAKLEANGRLHGTANSRTQAEDQGTRPSNHTNSPPAHTPTGKLADTHPQTNAASIANANGEGSGSIAKSMLLFGEPKRQRNKEHLKFVASKACLVCGRQPSDPHHLRFTQPRALGRKVSDEFTVPLCRTHHREVHRCTDEAKWWSSCGLDPLAAAAALWAQSHALRPENQRESAEPLSAVESAKKSSQLVGSVATTSRNSKTKPVGKVGSA